jgi:hypothetical protein
MTDTITITKALHDSIITIVTQAFQAKALHEN